MRLSNRIKIKMEMIASLQYLEMKHLHKIMTLPILILNLLQEVQIIVHYNPND